MKIIGNTVFITGGSSGIGLTLAHALLERDNIVIICGRNAAKLEAVQAAHPAIHTIVCDISDPGQLDSLVEQLQRDFSALNMLVNNAGIQVSYPQFADSGDTSGQIDQEIATNLAAPLHLTHQLLPSLLQQPEAAVVNVSSILGIVPRGDVPVYCATKAGLHAFSVALRRQLRDTSVKVFEVLPPGVKTALNTDSPESRRLTPQAVVDAVLSALEHDHEEISIGLASIAHLIHRFWPNMALNLVNK
jgi:short-subunit dehydrogenase involved in D-alanine esterification of teichoic acids